MKRFRTNLLAVDQGSIVMFSDFAHNGAMWAGDGPRDVVTEIRFDDSFIDPPIVQVAISMWDTDSDTNQRADLRAEDITCTGFNLVFRTWGDSRVGRIRADWTALGEVSDEDFWDVV